MDRFTEEQLAQANFLRSQTQNVSESLFLASMEGAAVARGSSAGAAPVRTQVARAGVPTGGGVRHIQQEQIFPSYREENIATVVGNINNINDILSSASSRTSPQYDRHIQNQNTITNNVNPNHARPSSGARMLPSRTVLTGTSGTGRFDENFLVQAGLVGTQGDRTILRNASLSNTSIGIGRPNILQQHHDVGITPRPRIRIIPASSVAASLGTTLRGGTSLQGGTIFSNSLTDTAGGSIDGSSIPTTSRNMSTVRNMTNHGLGTSSNLHTMLSTNGALSDMASAPYAQLLASASGLNSLQASAGGVAAINPTTRLVSISGGVPYSATTMVPLASSIPNLHSRSSMFDSTQGGSNSFIPQNQRPEGIALGNHIGGGVAGAEPFIVRNGFDLNHGSISNAGNVVRTTSLSHTNNNAVLDQQQTGFTLRRGGVGANSGVPGIEQILAALQPENEQDLLPSHPPSTAVTRTENAVWDHYYDSLKTFKAKFGNIYVQEKKDLHLSKWVNEQRSFFRRCKRSSSVREGNQMEISSQETQRRIMLLEELGFSDKEKPVGSLWKTQYNLLKKFKETYGHPHVPMHYKENKKLGHWVNNQRQLYRKYKSGNPTSMNETRIELLEELGFAWKLGKDWKDKRRNDVRKSQALELNDEISSHDDTEVVSVNSTSSTSDLNTATLPPEQFQMIPDEQNTEEPDQCSNGPASDESSVESKRHVAVGPKTFTGTRRVARKTKRKRPDLPIVEVEGRLLSHVLFSRSPSTFDEDSNSDGESGDEIPRKKMKQIQKKRAAYNTDKHWTKRFNDLVAFKEANGHCSVPFKFTENKSLSYWVSNQRQKYKKWLKGEDTMTQARVDALNGIGFCWHKSKGKSRKKGETQDTLFHTSLINVAQLEDVLVYEILSFIPHVQDIISFSMVSKFYQRIVNDSQHSNNLLKQAYSCRFGNSRMLEVGRLRRCSWMDIWKDIPKFHRSLKIQNSLEEGTLVLAKETSQNGFKSYKRSNKGIGILQRQKELQAVLYDNAAQVPIADRSGYPPGYSGMLCFNITLPPSISRIDDVAIGRKEQIAFWGDFDGLRVCDSFEHVSDDSKRIQFHSVGEARIGKVVTVLPSPPPSQSEGRNHHPRRPCLYLGCHSGAVIGISPVPGSDRSTLHSYGMSAMTFAHASEVTALSFLPKADASGDKVLLSAGRDGKVNCYPNAFSTRHQFEIHSRVLCCERKTPLLCVECSDNESSILMFTGDVEGKIVLWRPTSSSRNKPKLTSQLLSRDSYAFEPVVEIPSLDASCQVTKLSLATNDILVSGSSTGDIQVWDIGSTFNSKFGKRKKRTVSKSKSKPTLEQKFLIPIAHSGAIGSIIFIGNTLLTAGGNDGLTKIWSMTDGSLMGSIVSHQPGEERCDEDILDETSSLHELKCAVMSNFLRDACLVSFCRDGSLSCWQYGSLSKQKFNEVVNTSHNVINSASGRIDDHVMNLTNDGAADASAHGDESASSDEDDSETEYSWTCQRCNKTNTSFFTKCSSCYAWRSAADEENED